MKDSEIKSMLTAYNLDTENDAVKSFYERDNIWKILDIQRYEPSHSAFLVWFFNQKIALYSHIKYLLNLLVAKADKSILARGWNSTEDMPIFARAILTGSYSIKMVSVTPEVVINKLSVVPDRDRLDVFIRCEVSFFDNMGNEQEKSLEIILENKVDSTEGKGKAKDISECTTEYQAMSQTNRYYFACSKENGNRLRNDVDYQFFVFLTPNRKQCDCKNYVLITYQDMVDFVFETFLKRNDIDGNARDLIEAYLRNLGNPFNKNNKEIIAMDTEERELLVGFYNRNKQLFETTIQAMIQQARNDGDDEAVEGFKSVAEGLKKGSARRYYQINNEGRYTMCQVIEEYIKFKLEGGTKFEDIKRIGKKFISKTYTGVSIASGKDAKPYSFEYEGQKYFVTTQLRDGKSGDNFQVFRAQVNEEEDCFKISPISA